MKKFDKELKICLIAYALTAASIAWGHETGPEYIESFDTVLEIRDDGILDVAHRIEVHPHGNEIRRGLFFDLPDHVGPTGDYSVTLNGQAIAPSFDDGAIVVAAEAPLEVHRVHRFEVRYRADAPWWLESAGSARLRWEPVIEQFDLAWRSASLQLSWPVDGPVPELPAAGRVDGNQWRLKLRGPIHESGRDGALGSIDFRVDAARLPTAAVRHHDAEWGWRALLAVLTVGLLLFLHASWRAVGRDPDLGSVPERRTPPEGISPAATRFVDRMGFDETAFFAALVSLRVKRLIEWSVDDDGDSMTLRRVVRSGQTLSPGERAVLEVLFEDDDSATLEAGDERGAKASEALKKKLGEEHRGRHFVTNSRQRTQGIVAGLVVAAAGAAGLVSQARDNYSPDPWLIGLGLVVLLVGLIAPAVYFELFKAPTRAGVTVKRQIAGLKRYLLSGSTVHDTRHFVELLPYSVALEAEESWRERLAPAERGDEDRDALEVLEWYRKVQREHDSIGAMVPIMAAAAGASTGAAAGGGGASAGGV
jgi:hypothetical protein